MASNSGGVKVFSLQGRLFRERERAYMSCEEREWRAKWVSDQRLKCWEPVEVPELYKELYNPIKRAYRKPLDAFQRMLTPTVGIEHAATLRYVTGKILMSVALIYAGTYYMKYHANDWTRKKGWRTIVNNIPVYPNDTVCAPIRTKPSEYASRGFDKSPL